MTQIFRHVGDASEALIEHFGGVDHFDEGAPVPRNSEFTEEIVAKRDGYCVEIPGSDVCYTFDSPELAQEFIDEVLVGGDFTRLGPDLLEDFGISSEEPNPYILIEESEPFPASATPETTEVFEVTASELAAELDEEATAAAEGEALAIDVTPPTEGSAVATEEIVPE